MEIVRVGSLYINLNDQGVPVSARIRTAKGAVRANIPAASVLDASGVVPVEIDGKTGKAALFRHVEVKATVETVDGELTATVTALAPAPEAPEAAEVATWLKMHLKATPVTPVAQTPSEVEEPRF